MSPRSSNCVGSFRRRWTSTCGGHNPRRSGRRRARRPGGTAEARRGRRVPAIRRATPRPCAYRPRRRRSCRGSAAIPRPTRRGHGRSSSPRPSARRRPGRPLLDQRADPGRHPARQRLDDRGHQPQRRRPQRPEPRAGPEPGLGPRRLRRPDRPRPAGRQGAGRRLSRRIGDLAVAVHAGLDLFDLNRVETLRGPQGTLFGSGSVGGTIRYITNQPKLDRIRRAGRSQRQPRRRRRLGGHLKGAINVPIGDTPRPRVGYTEICRLHRRKGPAAAARTSTTAAASAAGSRCCGSRPTDIRSRRASSTRRSAPTASTAQEVYNLYANPFTTTRPVGELRRARAISAAREKFKDDTFLADLTASIASAGRADLGDELHQPRHPGQPRRQRADRLGLGRSQLPSRRRAAAVEPRDTTELKQFTQELRLSSTGDGPFQWLFGGFYSEVDRVYKQRLPTPGYDAFTDARFGAGTAAAVANGFPLNSPYNADLPYDIKQKALFGEASYDFGQFKLTGGGRYYDFKEVRDFVSGGLFSNGDTSIDDKTKSDGFSPAAACSATSRDNLSVNLQAAKGFRLGGVNDPLNEGLCSAQDRIDYGGFDRYDDESLWNYEAGVKSKFGVVSFNAAAFYTDISNLQVTADAGSARRAWCSTPTPTRWASSSSSPLGRRRVSICRSRAAGSRRSSTRPGSSRTGRCSKAFATATGCRPCPGSRSPPAPSTPSRSAKTGTRPISGHLPACRDPLHPAGRPGEQSAHLRPRPALRRRAGGRLDDPGPQASRLSAGQPQRGARVRRRLRSHSLRQQYVRRECDPGLRPRARRPRPSRLPRRPAATIGRIIIGVARIPAPPSASEWQK
jgi:hypothetical protein